MKKILTASIAGMLLMAGVAASADPNTAVVRVGDRLGSSSATTNQDQGSPVLLLIGGAALVAIIVVAVASSNHGHSHSVSS